VKPTNPIARAIQKMAASPTFAKVGPRFAPKMDKVVHRLTGGRFTLSEGVVPIVMLTTIGAKTGQQRTTPLATVPDGDDFLIVGSNFGREHHPAWSTNLIANPSASVEFRGELIGVHAHLLDEAQKAAIWPHVTELWPPFDQYEDRSGRELRVFRLVRV